MTPLKPGIANNESELVSSTLQHAEVHAEWLNDFYADGARAFYESAFDHIVRVFGSRARSTVLDAGCGAGSQTIRLALRGYPVVALDVSEYVLERARANVAGLHLSDMVTFERGSLSNLPMHDSSFDYVVCWNALMVVPEIEKAVAELCRVVKPDGFLVISEDNLWSLEAFLVRMARRMLVLSGMKRMKGKDLTPPKITAAGAEYWHRTDAGLLLSRVTRISWLIAAVGRHGFELKERIAGEFLEAHIAPGKFLKRCAHRFNRWWFERVRLPYLAMGNVLIFQKRQRGI